MEQQLEHQSDANHSLGHHQLDLLSVVGVVGGSVAALVSQQVALAALPLSFSVVLNLVNRRRLLQEMNNNHQTAIAHLAQQMQNHQSNLQFQQSSVAELTQHTQAHQTRFEQLSEQLSQFQQLTADLSQDSKSLHDALQNLDVQQKQIEAVVGELRQLENVSQAIRANPNSAQFYYQRGMSYQRLGDRQGAIEDFTAAIRLDMSYARAYHNRGLLNAELGNRKAAVEDLRKAAKGYFEAGDIESYQEARDLSKAFYALNCAVAEQASENPTQIPEKLIVSSLFT